MQLFSGAIINLIIIMLMGNVYTAIAKWLTKWGKFAIDFGKFFFVVLLVCLFCIWVQ